MDGVAQGLAPQLEGPAQFAGIAIPNEFPERSEPNLNVPQRAKGGAIETRRVPKRSRFGRSARLKVIPLLPERAIRAHETVIIIQTIVRVDALAIQPLRQIGDFPGAPHLAEQARA